MTNISEISTQKMWQTSIQCEKFKPIKFTKRNALSTLKNAYNKNEI